MKRDKEQFIPAGGFSSWLHRIRSVQKKKEGIIVPCGECRACCTSSYFIHIKSDETRTMAKIPKALLFNAPLQRNGNMLLGYDENGFCPMFMENHCTIYDHRPETCRTYDCRIFSATGFHPGEDKPLIFKQAGRWKFDFKTTRDRKNFSALRSASIFLRRHAECFPKGTVPDNSAQLAVVAIKVYDVFLNDINKSRDNDQADLFKEIMEEVLSAYEKFEKGFLGHV